MFVTCFHEIRIYESTIFVSGNFFLFLLKQGIEIKYVAKTVYFHKEKYVAAPLKEIRTFFVKNNFLIRNFGIRQNMLRAS